MYVYIRASNLQNLFMKTYLKIFNATLLNKIERKKQTQTQTQAQTHTVLCVVSGSHMHAM